MVEIKPYNDAEDGSWYSKEQQEAADTYFTVEDEMGVLRCSCGRELIKMDEETYECPGGYPQYRFKNGEVVIDKFGNLMMKNKPHGKEEKDEGAL